MKFVFTKDTPDEAKRSALAVAKYLSKLGLKVRTQAPGWSDAPYRTTLLGVRSGLQILVEAQGSLNYSAVLKKFLAWLAIGRHYAELYLATTSDTALEAVGTLAEMKKDGVGLLLVDEGGGVSVHQVARNQALVVTPDPTLRYGECKAEVLAAVRKFNDTDRKDGLRDMCELVERETERLALLAVRRGYLNKTEQEVKGMDWETQINVLAAKGAYHTGHVPILEHTLKTDLLSFKGARNLLDHKTRGKREDASRERQFAERMMQGPRLVAEIGILKRKV